MTAVSMPQSFDPAWVKEPTEYTLERYSGYYASHKLEEGSEGWASWGSRFVAKKMMSIGSWILPGPVGKVVDLANKYEIPYKAAGAVVESAHAAHVAKTRCPIDHDRVLKVVERLGLIQNCTNCELLFERVQKESNYLLASKASSDLMYTLASKDESVDAKFQAIIAYLMRPATLKDYEDIYYNNGKKLYQVLICLTEQATIT